MAAAALAFRPSPPPRPLQRPAGGYLRLVGRDNEGSLARPETKGVPAPMSRDAATSRPAFDTSVRDLVRRGLSDAPSKTIARAANVNHRAVEAWRAGRSLPSLPMFLQLYAHVPGFRAEVERAMGEPQADPINEMLQILRRLEGR